MQHDSIPPAESGTELLAQHCAFRVAALVEQHYGDSLTPDTAARFVSSLCDHLDWQLGVRLRTANLERGRRISMHNSPKEAQS